MLIQTTTVTVTRPDGSGDPYEAASTSSIGTALPAHVSSPSGSDARVGGAQQVIDATLLLDTTPVLQRADIVADDLTGDSYRVAWTRQRTGLGLDHQVAGLVAVSGGANG